MLPLRFLLVLSGLFLTARATTVIPPSFDELVGNSELVFRGRVTAVKPVSRKAGARDYIATEVTFAVERALRGAAGETLTLEFLGGSIGGKELRLAGWPRFEVGERGIFFVEDRAGQVCPLMRLRHGRYRITVDGSLAEGGTERVLRDDHSPLRDVQEVTLPIGNTNIPRRVPLASDALSLQHFETQIVERSAALPRTNANR